jgi:hypothetical protein
LLAISDDDVEHLLAAVILGVARLNFLPNGGTVTEEFGLRLFQKLRRLFHHLIQGSSKPPLGAMLEKTLHAGNPIVHERNASIQPDELAIRRVVIVRRARIAADLDARAADGLVLAGERNRALPRGLALPTFSKESEARAKPPRKL